MSKLESAIQSDIIKWLKKRTATLTYKHPPSPSGIPDIVHYEEGVPYFFEVKRSKKDKLKPLQKFRFEQLISASIKVYLVRSLKEVKKIMKHEVKH